MFEEGQLVVSDWTAISHYNSPNPPLGGPGGVADEGEGLKSIFWNTFADVLMIYGCGRGLGYASARCTCVYVQLPCEDFNNSLSIGHGMEWKLQVEVPVKEQFKRAIKIYKYFALFVYLINKEFSSGKKAKTMGEIFDCYFRAFYP